MKQSSIILVTDVTEAAGRGVAEALLLGEKHTVRILTPSLKAETALALRRAGAEIVRGSMNSVDSLRQAMAGCYGVFGSTSSWETPERIIEQGRNVIDAAQQAGIRHLVLDTQASYREMSGGAMPVPVFDAKAAVEAYARERKMPATFVRASFYYENFLEFFRLQGGEDGAFYFGFPQGDTPMAMVSAEDVGGVVATIFDHPAHYIGRVVGVVAEDATCEAYAATMSRVLDREVVYEHIPYEAFAGITYPAARELANLFEVQRRHVHNRRLDLIESYGLNPRMQRFEAWLVKHKAKFAAILEPKGQLAEVG